MQKQKMSGACQTGEETIKTALETETAVAPETESSAKRTIRVLIKTGDYAQYGHAKICVSSAQGFTVSDGLNSLQFAAGTEVEFCKGETGIVCRAADNAQSESRTETELAGTLYLTAVDGEFLLPQLSREQSGCAYKGSLEIQSGEQGLLLTNVLSLEDYLCGVVPSEMPSSYPEEALKAQAVCARTYALWQIREKRLAEYGADVDDSVSFQVYNNQERTQQTDAAVRETADEVLTKDGEILETLYYSTSCGAKLYEGLSEETTMEAFLTTGGTDACEAEEPWYRWKTKILLKDLDGVEEILIRERAENGAVTLLEAVYGDGAKTELAGEYQIREFLGRAHAAVTLQDGETVENMELLPSAFFVLKPEYENGALCGYQIAGGGYGHGEGMSQNGAKHLAYAGADYEEILKIYYGEDAAIRLA